MEKITAETQVSKQLEGIPVKDNEHSPSIGNYQYEVAFQVRDYECDLQGVVNNAVYLHYLEHGRHEFLYAKGIDFARLHQEGKDLVLIRIEADYKLPLRSRDRFVVRMNVVREGRLRLVFIQDLYRLPDEKLVLKAKATGVCVHKGKPTLLEEVAQAFF
ncbi:acyl-CoA thioesterase [Heliobacterium gestii]|uniref:Acyl-CoA thioesterase n=1 Tax=Heliomicrobium gestii TaxID=2699 RepID=A0A845LH95_HELGE|nr:acyl-CoA thioesterase [Heliomicrobium gestii]MBM7867230.1 acyl-CoA thioester hydrolase [Heliomicrobium gestii]MZP43785.1 acyl-CoA thioesterase [Heliomicrobium gestii]